MEPIIDTNAVIERIKKELAEFYNGANWVTENFITKVLSLNADVALKKIQGHSHSIAELVSHMASWRNFATQKLTGNDDYDIDDNSAINWPHPVNWKAVCEQFESVHQDLLSAIENFSPKGWNAKVPGRNYSFIYLINGVLQHDYYHYGQIGSLLAGIKKM